MTSERRKRTEQLFQAALDLPVEQRAKFLQEQCGGDEELRAETEHLLGVQDELGDFLKPIVPIGTLEQAATSGGLVDHRLDPAPAEIPDTLGHYEVEREIGRGGMGMVYLAEDTKLGRKAAIKMLPAEFAHDPVRARLFENEARTAGNLNHPNIATIYEFDEDNGFIAMEFVEGRLLSELTKRPKPIPVAGILNIGVQIAEGLAAAHANEVIHRDLKPGNLMITPHPERRVKILDFGIAKAIQQNLPSTGGSSRSLTGTSSGALGTPGYSSPEQLRGDPLDQRSDLFSFGVVLYELAAGVSPFLRDSFGQTIHAVLHEQPPPPATLNARLPPELAALIEKLLSKRPRDRYRSAAKVLAELRRIQRDFEGEREGRRSRRPLQLALIAVALVALVTPVWLLATLRETDPRVVEINVRLEANEIPSAMDLYRELEAEWGPDDERLPDPRRMEAHDRIGRGEIQAAREGLEQLALEWGEDDPRIQVLRDAFDERQTGLIEENEKNLEHYLADGDIASAEGTLADIRSLAGESSKDERAARLVSREAELREDTEAAAAFLRSELAGAVEASELRSVWTGVLGLRKKEFEGRSFALAVEAGERLRQQLVAKIERRDDPELSKPELEELHGLLSESDPDNAMLTSLSQRIGLIEEQQKLMQLRETANEKRTAKELERVLIEMETTDPVHHLTREVEDLYERRYAQEASYRKGFNAFSDKSTGRLERAVADYEDTRPFQGQANEELEALRSALAWLKKYLVAWGQWEEDPSRARWLHDDLEPANLSKDFVPVAKAHLAELSTELEKAELRKLALARCGSVERSCRLLQLEAAQSELQALADTRAEGVQGEVEAERYRVAALAREVGGWETAEGDYMDFRRQLRDRRVDAKLSLVSLERKWREERAARVGALEFDASLEAGERLDPRERDALRRRCVLLSLRLGDFAKALQDAEDLLPTVEGSLLRAQARFVVGGRDSRRIQQALKDVEEALSKSVDESQQQRLYYMRGTLRHEWSERGDGSLLPQARRDLERAIDAHGLDSADAYYRLAAIHLKGGDSGKAIDYSTRALSAPLTEEEIVLVIGGNAEAVEGDTVRVFERDAHYLRARGHYGEGNWQGCADDCTAVIRLDGSFVYGFFWRGLARFKLDQWNDAGRDFGEFLELTEDTDDPRLGDLRRETDVLIGRMR
jgi:hypothetical protein